MPPGPRRRGPRSGGTWAGGQPLTLPQATTLPATLITNTSAYLNGSVNPESNAASYWFAYGPTSAYGSVSATTSAGAGVFPVTVGFALTGLTTGQTYHYAVVAQSAAGTVYGADVSFVVALPSPTPTPSNVLTDYGTTLAEPHFLYPFTMTPQGAVVVEQDSLSEVFSCVRAIVACPENACPEMPGFGVPDLLFSNAPLDPTAMLRAIREWEPRATETALEGAIGDADLGTRSLILDTAASGSDPSLT